MLTCCYLRCYLLTNFIFWVSQELYHGGRPFHLGHVYRCGGNTNRASYNARFAFWCIHTQQKSFLLQQYMWMTRNQDVFLIFLENRSPPIVAPSLNKAIDVCEEHRPWLYSNLLVCVYFKEHSTVCPYTAYILSITLHNNYVNVLFNIKLLCCSVLAPVSTKPALT